MIKLGNNQKTLYFFDTHNMMLDRSDWNKFGRGDALWRTALALICSGMVYLVISVSFCRTMKNGKIRFLRHPDDLYGDTSRDQSIMALIALKLHSRCEYEHITRHLYFRISKKFTWQDAYLWAKENYLLWRITSCYHFIGWWFEPAYSVHLFCWMLWSSKQKAPLIRWYLLKFIVPEWNYLQRALLGDKFTPEDIKAIENYKPRVDFIWQRDFNEEQHPLMTEEQAEYNRLDQEVLWYVLNTNIDIEEPSNLEIAITIILSSIIGLGIGILISRLL